jgi:Fur family ferric uptake transcriptional regulator
MTEPRATVLKVFLKTEGHLTAEGLSDAVRKINPGIGQATVFRTIKLLADAGLAREACQDEGPRQFEHAFRHSHHDHLQCIVCGKIIEFYDSVIEKNQEAVFKRYGFAATGHRMELFGVCPDCANQQKPSGQASDGKK